jgi:hypothetical protein
MDAASPARLYATVVGALLVVFGIAGFFYSASFGSPGSVDQALGAFRCNAWLNLLHVAAGSIGLLLAGVAARGYALALGALFTALAIWGFVLGGEASILGFLPAGSGENWLHLGLGLLGLLAAAGTPKSPMRGSSGTKYVTKEPRDRGKLASKARTKRA